MTVRLTRYDPVITEIAPFTTPREYLLWGHRFFPIVVFTVVMIKKVFYVDMEKHHQRVLIHMLEKNMVRAHFTSRERLHTRSVLINLHGHVMISPGNGGGIARGGERADARGRDFEQDSEK